MKKYFALLCVVFVLGIAGCSPAPAPKVVDFLAQDAEVYKALTADNDGAPDVEVWEKAETSIGALKAFLSTKASLKLQAEDLFERETFLHLAADFPEKNLRVFIYDTQQYLGAAATPLWVFLQVNRNGKVSLISVSNGALVPMYNTSLVAGNKLILFLTESMNSGKTAIFAFDLSADIPQTCDLGIDYEGEFFSIRTANRNANDINKSLKMSRIQRVDEMETFNSEITQTPNGFAVNGVPFHLA